MFMHTCARNTMYTCILKPTSQIYLIFDSWISLKAKIYAISSDTHQLQFIKLHHFKQEIFLSI